MGLGKIIVGPTAPVTKFVCRIAGLSCRGPKVGDLSICNGPDGKKYAVFLGGCEVNAAVPVQVKAKWKTAVTRYTANHGAVEEGFITLSSDGGWE